MNIRPVGTFCYRLLVDAAYGETLGNTVYVGIEVERPDERAQLLFSGLPTPVGIVRDALEDVRIDGHLFEPMGATDARDLALAMRRLDQFRPVLVLGEAPNSLLDLPKAPE